MPVAFIFFNKIVSFIFLDNAHKKKQIGKFRSADIRWSLEIHKIDWVVLKPGQPPMYKVDNETT